VNVLFVCTLNKARSVAAVRLYRHTPGLAVRSAGTSDRAAHPVTAADLAWADRVIVFEPAHARHLRATFPGPLPEILDAGVEDNFTLRAPELEDELREALTALLGPPG
jgi:predicted protein tyrosine phosphatase